MTDEFSTAAKKLSDSEKRRALEYLLETADEPEVGIIRQILGGEGKSLTEKQNNVYEKHIIPSLVDKCGARGCNDFCVAGDDYCATCAIKYGE